MSASSDNAFQLLPVKTQQIIDRAFDKHGVKEGHRLDKERVPDGFRGGFIASEPSDNDAEDEPHNLSTRPTHIALAQIPSALQYLDLAPDDEQVLGVFRNAASGWSSASMVSARATVDGDLVSRDDWRAVCAVLLDGRNDDALSQNYDNQADSRTDKRERDEAMRTRRQRKKVYESNDDDNGNMGGGFLRDDDEGEDDGDIDDEYKDSEASTEEEDNNESDDGYAVGASTSTKRRRTRGSRKQTPSPSPPGSPIGKRGLTSRQQQGCRDAYALFFPDTPEEQLLQQRVMIKDIQRVAKTLGEHIKSEEIIEMLEMFSTSPDKSMSYVDFCRMMVKAKLV